MRIAQISPAWESVPPQGYGGIERVISYLTEELVRLGHDVTLFATAESKTAARLVPISEHAVRQAPDLHDATPLHVAACAMALKQADAFDVLHFHIDFVHFPLVESTTVPTVTTFHNRLDEPELRPMFEQFAKIPVVSISQSHRTPAPNLNWVANIYHGLPLDLYHLQDTPQDYLAFLGRICPEKGVDRAIKIANRVGMPLKIASKIDDNQRQYLEEEIRPLLDLSDVEFVGEVSDAEKQDFLGNAKALLFPIDWPEPFGLVMIEAMACGTPVIATRCGAVPEVMNDGVTGYVCDNVDECVNAIMKLDRLSREQCRLTFEERFSVTRMANDYVATFEALQRQRSVQTTGS